MSTTEQSPGFTREQTSLARIVAQHLATPLDSAVEAVRHLGCVQGQDLPGALLALALRSRARALDEVVRAFDRGQLVRNWTMRGTLHVVEACDNDWILGLTGPRMESGQATRHRQLGIDEELVGRARAVAERLLTSEGLATPGACTRAELFAAWDEDSLLPGVTQRDYHLLSLLCRRGVLLLGPLRARGSGVEQLVVLREKWFARNGTTPLQLDEDEALARWARVFFTGHGPATEADFARWTGLTLGRTRRAIAANPGLERFRRDGETHLMAPGLPERVAAESEQAARMMLLPGFDELVLGYKDRSVTVPPAHAQAIVPGNNGIFRHTVVEDGQVVGTWRRGTVRRSDPDPAPVVTWLDEPSPARLEALAGAVARLPR